MKKTTRFVFILFCSSLAHWSFAQNSFRNCAAAFLNNKMVVNEYTNAGKCVVSSTAAGELSLYTVDLSPTQAKAVDKIEFKVAIRDQNTKTLTMFAREDFKQVEIQKVLAKCKKGDYIVLLTLDEQYALPHNEILVQ